MNKIFFLVILISTMFSCNISEKELEYGLVTSASPEATKAGMQILKAGGNAVDAAIAVSFALGVSEPAMSGIGGGTQVQIYLPQYSKPFAINGSTLSPALTPKAFESDSLKGHLRTTIPSTVKVMQYLFDKYGSKKISWMELLQPAIEIAEKGIQLGPFRSKVYQRYQEKLAKGMPNTSEYFSANSISGTKQAKMVKTLKLIANQGASAFYTGEIAHSIEKDMLTNGGWVTKEDLAKFPEPDSINSIYFKHNGFDVYTQPEPCGGWVVKEILEKLARLRKDKPNEDEITMLVEAISYGHGLRQKLAENNSGETTHFSVMDRQGMTVSITSSINAYYGAGVANAEFGFLYNSYMDDFIFDDAANTYSLGPNKMAYSSMSPTIVMKDNRVVLVIGSPGSARIISTVAQLIDTYTRGQIKPENLLKQPRIHAIDEKIYFEDSSQEDKFKIDDKLDWSIEQPSSYFSQNGLNAFFGGVHAIVWTGQNYIALADPRRDGMAISQ